VEYSGSLYYVLDTQTRGATTVKVGSSLGLRQSIEDIGIHSFDPEAAVASHAYARGGQVKLLVMTAPQDCQVCLSSKFALLLHQSSSASTCTRRISIVEELDHHEMTSTLVGRI